MGEKVFVTVHIFDVDKCAVRTYRTLESAEAYKVALARECWSVKDNGPLPATDAEISESYWDQYDGEEAFYIEESEIRD